MSEMKVGVVGAGTMGCGVTLVLAQAQQQVILVDIDEAALVRAKENIVRDLRFQYLFGKKDNFESQQNIIDRIEFTTDYQKLSAAYFIVENVTEKWQVKQQVYSQLDQIVARDVIFAANTSCISITKIAASTKRSENIIGIHFMNPVHLKNTVEVIKGHYTSEDCIARTIDFLKKMHKSAVIVNDSPGFVSNRISHLLMNEAAFVVYEGVATVTQVDKIFKQCYEHKMGPLETADLIGLDTVVDSLDVLFDSFKDQKFRCCPLLRKMVDAGLLGRKSGKGFYDY